MDEIKDFFEGYSVEHLSSTHPRQDTYLVSSANRTHLATVTREMSESEISQLKFAKTIQIMAYNRGIAVRPHFIEKLNSDTIIVCTAHTNEYTPYQIERYSSKQLETVLQTLGTTANTLHTIPDDHGKQSYGPLEIGSEDNLYGSYYEYKNAQNSIEDISTKKFSKSIKRKIDELVNYYTSVEDTTDTIFHISTYPNTDVLLSEDLSRSIITEWRSISLMETASAIVSSVYNITRHNTEIAEDTVLEHFMEGYNKDRIQNKTRLSTTDPVFKKYVVMNLFEEMSNFGEYYNDDSTESKQREKYLQQRIEEVHSVTFD